MRLVWPLLVAAVRAAVPTDAETPSGPLPVDTGPSSAVTTELLDDMLSRLAADGNAEGLRLLRGGDLLAALSAFKEAHEVDPTDPDITTNLAIVYRQLNDLDRAARFLKLALELCLTG
jgi:Flp pilus assembly protein TadD